MSVENLVQSCARLGGVPLFVIGLLGACGTSSPPPKKPVSLPVAEEPVVSPEWHYVSSQAKALGASSLDCGSARKWVEGEARCKGELCQHGHDLGKDWLQRCATVSLDYEDKVEGLVASYHERLAAPQDRCIANGTILLRTWRCGAPDACEHLAQKWIHTCGAEYATPLVQVVLKNKLERAWEQVQPEHRVVLDARSCKELEDGLDQHVACKSAAACEPLGELIERLERYCLETDRAMDLRTALRLTRGRTLMGQQPVAHRVKRELLGENDVAFQLSDNRGVLLDVCGKRPSNVDDFILARTSCKEGEVRIVHFHESEMVRVIAVPHPNDDTFSEWFPFLSLQGEASSRGAKASGAFRAALAEVVELASGESPESAVAPLAAALQTYESLIPSSEAFQAVLRDSDLALVPVFSAWAKTKVKAVTTVKGTDRRDLYIARAWVSPVHDTLANGQIQAGGRIASSSLSLESWMPASMAAYRREIRHPYQGFAKPKLPEARLEGFRKRVAAEIRLCAVAEKELSALSNAMRECLFQDESCSSDKLESLGQRRASPLRRATLSRTEIASILASELLPAEDIKRLEAERVGHGCLDP